MNVILIIGASLLLVAPPSICRFFSLTDPQQVDFVSSLIIEVIGSLFLAITAGGFLKYLGDAEQRNHDKKEAKYWLNERLPKILEHNFSRSNSFNYSYPNLKAFFDKSHINSTYDRFEDYRQKIYLY